MEKEKVTSRRIFYTLILLLVFEGLMRKLLPSALGLALFFLKDVLCLLALFLIVKSQQINGYSLRLVRSWKIVFIAFIPLFLNTIFRDAILGFFGLKQYLLFTVVALLMPVAFPMEDAKSFKTFVNVFTLMLIPTTIIAVIQNSLPGSHWLNLSVQGESLEGFAAAGFLRVSSTFSFTGQYSWFLNIVCMFLAVRLTMPEIATKKHSKFGERNISIILIISLLIGAFITGGRTAVLGSGLCLTIGFLLSSFKAPSKILVKGVAAIIGVFLLVMILRTVKPEFFAAYDKRSTGTEEISHSEEIELRVFRDAFHWAEWLFEQDFVTVLIGNGIGVTSNGSDKISAYASNIKAEGLGAESDFDATSWEGGMYLMVLWYGFRIWAISFCFEIWRNIKGKEYGVAASFLMAYVFVTGLYGALSKQPPISIWFWLAFGGVLTISRLDINARISNKKKELKKVKVIL